MPQDGDLTAATFSRSYWAVTKEAVHALHATPLAILLTFLLFAPMVAQNALPEILVLLDKKQAVTGVAPPGFVALQSVERVLYRSAFPMLVLAWIAGWPWIAGGTAGRVLDHLQAAPAVHTFSSHANRLYGRVFAITLLAAVPIVVLAALRSVAYDAIRDAVGPANYSESRPEVLATTLTFMVLDAAVLLLPWLAIAAAASEDRGVIGSIKSGVSFVAHERSRAPWLLISIVVMREISMLPIYDLQNAFRWQGSALAYFLVRMASAAWTSYTLVMSLALTVAIYRERRPRLTAL